ncbi:MAG: T9SS type A sorting domain-containing protein, partial [bacterium]
AVDSQMPVVGIDVTSPLERWGFAVLGSDTIFLREGAGAPYNAIDLMIRAMVSGTHGIDSEDNRLPKEVALHDNYPNPFNPATAITFELPQETKVELSVYNLLGERVTTLADSRLRAGTHRVTWAGRDDNGRDLPSGVYFYRLNTEEKDITKRMVLIK